MSTNKPLCKRDRTRQAIIRAAIEVLSKKGLDAVSIDDLMQTAGMARGTFYNYFQTREALLRAVLDDMRYQLSTRIERKIPSDSAPEVALACMAYAILHYHQANPSFGWAWIRLISAENWLTYHSLEDQIYPTTDNAVMAVLEDKTSFTVALVYIEGAVNNTVHRLLEGYISLEEAEQSLMLMLRGLGVKEHKIQHAIKAAKQFTEALGDALYLDRTPH